MGFDLEESGGGKNGDSDQNFSIWVLCQILTYIVQQFRYIKFSNTQFVSVLKEGTSDILHTIPDDIEFYRHNGLHVVTQPSIHIGCVMVYVNFRSSSCIPAASCGVFNQNEPF